MNLHAHARRQRMNPERRIARILRWYKRRPSPRLRDAIVRHYLPWIEQHAKRLHRKLPASVTVGDLISDASLGLLDAIEAFIPGKAKFETFGRPRVVGAMLDGLRSRDEVSRSLRSTARKLDAAVETLRKLSGGEPTPQQVADYLNVPLKAYLQQTRRVRRTSVRSLSDVRFSREHGRRDAEMPVAAAAAAAAAGRGDSDPRLHVNREAVKELVSKGLSRAERLVVVLYYYESLSMKEIGRVLDLSEARVCQIHASVLARLKARLTADELRV
jgi:RNA polymerase sigma factor for flagellar operon FliA